MIQQLPLQYQVPNSDEARLVEKIHTIIKGHHGRAAAISMHRISEVTGVQPRLIQAIVKFLVEERLLPIGTSTSKPFGYFWIETDEERRAVRDQFVRRAVSILQHAKAYDSQSIIGPLIGQLELSLEER